jgi:isoquinoline 1-oxidoreductase subunit alpha
LFGRTPKITFFAGPEDGEIGKTNCFSASRNVQFLSNFPGAKRMDAISITVNGKAHSVEVSPDTPLLWVLRDTLGLTGTKFGCGMALCGSCTVHVDGVPVRSCTTRISAVAGRSVITIEGLSARGDNPVQLAWLSLQVPQCGYCQAGMIMTSAALLAKNSHPSDAEIDEALAGHICRCGTYQRIRRAIQEAASTTGAKKSAIGGSR